MSKPIGDLTLKAAPAGADMIAIADSQDSNKTKKILVSALGGGGSSAQYYHELKNVSITSSSSTPINITADCDNLTAYEPGLYVLEMPTSISGARSLGVTLNINNLGTVWWRILTDYNSGVDAAPKNFIITGGIYILVYNDIATDTYFRPIYAPTIPIKQTMVMQGGSTPSIDLSYFGSVGLNNVHVRYEFTDALSSLTLSHAPIANQGFEQEIHFTTGSTFVFTASDMTGKWLGVSAPTFEPNTSYVIAIKNGYGVCAKVGA